MDNCLLKHFKQYFLLKNKYFAYYETYTSMKYEIDYNIFASRNIYKS